MTNNQAFKATEADLSWREKKAAKAMRKSGYADEQIDLVIRAVQLNVPRIGSVDSVDDKCLNRTF